MYIDIYYFDTSDQRKPQGYISHIALTYLDITLWLGGYHDIALPLMLRQLQSISSLDCLYRAA